MPRVIRPLVWLIAAHSVAVGLVLVFAMDWGLALGGWPSASPRFFVRQFGVFHFVAAAAYLIEYERYRGVRILLTAKAIAVLSLVDAVIRYGGPWMIGLAALGDAAMAAAVIVLRKQER